MCADRRRPVALRRSWLFLPGAERSILAEAGHSGADVLIQELEDFVPPARREEARRLIADTMAGWKRAGALAAVRINPLHGPDGSHDLEAAMRGGAQTILLPKTRHRGDIAELDRAITRWERELDRPHGGTEIVPNIESAAALREAYEIASASERVVACLVASEDMATDLNAERAPDGVELSYVRHRFLVECVAAGKLAVDCPYTFSDAAGAAREAKQARRLGYFAKSLVDPGHVAAINAAFTPSAEQIAHARRLIEAFDKARAAGQPRVELDGALVEVPTYQNARRLLARAEAFAALVPQR
jgi:citrate lyase subunit beta/citryl-CoA lyase